MDKDNPSNARVPTVPTVRTVPSRPVAGVGWTVRVSAACGGMRTQVDQDMSHPGFRSVRRMSQRESIDCLATSGSPD
jgi:hypothetical protein